MITLRGKWSQLAFKVTVIFKLLDGILEIIASIALLVTSQDAIRQLVHSMTRSELLEDPDDFIATHLVSFFDHFSLGTKHFAILYLLGYGIVKTALGLALLLEKIWAFPWALALLFLFLIFQLHHLYHTHSLILAVLTIIDIIAIILIWNEYRRLKLARSVAAQL